MRAGLLVTTAISLGLAPMAAAAAEKISIKVGGFYTEVITFVDEDADTNALNVDQEGEIHFTGETTLDNGLTVGVQVELEGYTKSDQIDEHYVWLEGSFGKMTLGAENGAAYLSGFNAPSVVPNHGQNDPTYQHITDVQNGSTSHALNAASDANKITYYTPRIGGFQVGASYTPDATGGNLNGYSSAYGFPPDTGDNEDIFSGVVNYKDDFGDFTLGGSAGFEYVENASSGPAALRQAPDGDIFDWQLGALLEWQGWNFGGGYIHRSDGRGWSAVGGFIYSFGLWSVGADYGYYEDENDDAFHRAETGVTYKLGPGITASYGVYYYNDEDAGDAESFATGVTLKLSY